ncbi:MAG: cell division protein FtsK/SpoIIIE [Amycolatopsis sp.]|uniref:FtsK/SpoIIIE domain-containing protein n=1 Tax=Amycolatopsis sp. TaxID=37632 RepID=UPI002604AB7A|nr:FtsK/SpoIIIE domain-containing protein [Amycolatopsis sp.]MCU1685311.1 cell division protein FtsK/SpoIIIE [Amycolatopsis sp.]
MTNPEATPIVGELVDADHDGLPDTTHTAELDTSGQVFDAELVEDPPVAVDSARVERLPLNLRVKRAERRPVLPEWIKSREEAQAVAEWLAGHIAHVAAFHAVRLPLYLAKLAMWSPVGLVTAGAAGVRWVFDAEAAPLRVDAVRRTDAEMYLKLARERSHRVRHRMWLAGILTALATTGGVLAWLLAPTLILAGMSTAVMTVFGLIGAPRDKPIAGTAVVVERYQRLTSEMVERSLSSLGVASLSGKGVKITFAAPIQRDGPGWRAEVDLPFGVTVADVSERRDRLASGLRRPLGCVWPEPVSEEHPGRLVLWVGDLAMNKAKPAVWPLLKAGQADIFAPAPFMTDQRGRPVGVDLVFNNMLIGAMPRMGKTFSVRELVLFAALDPYVQLRLFELKGTGDLGMCEPVAHHYASGSDTGTLDACMASLRELYADLEKRSKTITRIAKEDRARCPENKVTAELSRDPKLGLGIVFLTIDECQELFSHKDYRDEAERLCEGLVKRGPAMGIILVLATQRPDAKSLPKSISDNAGIRFCLRVMGQEPNDMVLGTSSYKNGIRASTFSAKDKGIGYLVGATDDPIIGRTYYIDGPDAEKVIDRARLLREKAGTLTGYAVGEDQPLTVNVADDVRAVFAGPEERLWGSTILERLAVYRPQVYGSWGADQLAAALKPFGIRPEQVWGTTDEGKGANRNGYAIESLARALTH